jgi:ubiquinone/menaquinone biosynthesis C-methylase UbiE
MRSQASVNYWPESACARAFWGQQELPPYRRLLADTAAWLEPRPGERWLDLGCGCGQLTRLLWEASGGAVAEIVGLDFAAANQRAFEKLCFRLEPFPPPDRIRFVLADFATGLPAWDGGYFDGVVSGLAIQYAGCYSDAEGHWTTAAYDRTLAEVYRVLRPGGRFVFSVNVPEPAWGKVALQSLPGVLRARHPLHYLKRALRMWTYGGWLKREARRGRFHYLPLDVVRAKLTAAGFHAVEHRLSYAGQAYVLRCRKAGLPTPN